MWKWITSLFFLISGFLVVSWIYLVLTIYVILNHGKPGFLGIPALFLANAIILGSVYNFIRRFNLSRSTKRIIVFTIIIISLIPTMYFGYEMYCNQINWRFTTEKWKNLPDKRVYMVDEMLEKNKLDGRSREEIGSLLGVPSQMRDDVMVYFLGPERGFIRLDDELLIINFDINGKVSGYSVSRH